MLNNSSTSELAFNVMENSVTVISVSSTKNPATSTTSFVVNHDRSSTELDVVLDIFDTLGRQLVRTEDRCLYGWDGRHRLGSHRWWRQPSAHRCLYLRIQISGQWRQCLIR